MLVRTRVWRSELVAWADKVRGAPYLWGETDCSTLARQALRIQFGQDVFPRMLRWTSLREALRVLKTIGGVGGVSPLFAATGARELQGRKKHWPVGAILMKEEEGTRLPAFAVSMGQYIIESDLENGVQWCEAEASAPLVKAAWLLERANVEDTVNG